jgi:hypothetical protein
MSILTVVFGALFVVLSFGGTLGVYYFVTGDWLWEREQKKEDRNWSPPR